jgi:hypothetical protein
MITASASDTPAPAIVRLVTEVEDTVAGEAGTCG